jgi:phosphoribosylformylglycinamidine cyclo-ligase
MAHITGGGLTDNVPRVLPETRPHRARLLAGAADLPADYEKGGVQGEDAARLNMGIGMVLILAPEEVERVPTSMRSPEVLLHRQC